MAQQNGLSFYTRSVDGGHGFQLVTVKDGIIEAQSLKARGYHHYTGDGNPELVGQSVAALRGMGFQRVDERGGEHSRYQQFVEGYYAAQEAAAQDWLANDY